MEKAIKRLKELAEDNTKTADIFEDQTNTFGEGSNQMSQKRRDNLVSTYRYWSQCLYIAAWLLAKDQENT